MNLKFIMFFLDPYYRWKTRRDTLKQFNMKSPSEILNKKKEFEAKYLIAEKLGNEKDMAKYRNYREIIDWIIGCKT